MFHSSGRSPRRSQGKSSAPPPPAPVHFSRGAETIRAVVAPGGPLAGGSESSVLRFFFPFFAGLSRRRHRFAIRGVSATLRVIYIILFIGADNLLHQVVPHHVLLSKVHHGNPVNLAANFQRFDQAGLLSLRQVGPRLFAGHPPLGL